MKAGMWFWPVEMRKLLFEISFRTKKVNDARPKGCVWNRWKVKVK